jgi:NAD(P)-dependent dehydrogenase (short-subunit alcohol dehydrogenase family)
VSRAFEQFGRLDILVANAGVLMAQPLLETTIESYDLQNNTNARAVFFLVQAAARHMIDGSGGGSIVLISSDAAVKPFRGLGAYCISKAAVNMLARVAAAELGEYGIRVNVVAPGTTETDMNRELLADPATREELLRSVVLGRPGSPLDVARAVCYLASDAASFVTGASIAVDGGSSAM